MKNVRLFFTAILMLLSAAVASAQSQEVSGVVTDASTGDPVPFASVMVKGTMTGVSAGADGSYKIKVASRDEAVLVFSFVGYKTTEIPVGGEIIVDCALEVEAEYLKDVIVVAYGTMTREANTGAVTSIKNEGLAESPAMTVDKMLSGKMAGVQITSGSGQPGSTSTIRIRGTSSINAGNEPLWVIDGIPVVPGDMRQLSNAGVGSGSSTTFLNPNDIESITVLKDAAAASVYGSRAANGVIIVTTKTGKQGKARFTARAKYGVQQLINDHNIRPLTGEELIDYRRMAAINAGHNPDDPNDEYYFTSELLTDGTTDWYKELTRLGSVQEYEINASGGTYNDNIQENANTNPRAIAAYDTYNDKEYRAQGTMYLEWKPIPQLSIKTTDAVDGTFMDSRQYWAPETNDGEATLFTIRTKDLRLTTSNTITYADSYAADTHHLRVVLGQEAMTETYDYLYGYSPGVNPQIPYPTTSTAASDQVDYYIAEETLLSFFGIADYNYMNKYFIQGSVRADGSSLFGSDSKWGVFWSVGGSWNISSEKWMQPANNWLSILKLRASYGVNGNNNIAAYQAYGVYATREYNGYAGMRPATPSNPNLAWEKNKTWNVGLDFGFFDYRLTGNIDVYNRLTDDMLLDKTVPYTTGFATNFMNVGSIRNRGVEIMLEGDIIRSGDWNWSAGFNIAFNRSKVLDIGDSEFLEVGDSRVSSTSSNAGTPIRIVEGKSLYTFYLRDWYGVNPSTGDGLWWTEDGKLTSDRNKARYVYAGSPEPKATGGFNTEVSWKGLSLSAYFEFITGNKTMETNAYIDDGYNMNINATTVSTANYWQKPGTQELPRKWLQEIPAHTM